LKDGSLIVVRVRAENSKGFGKFSPVNIEGAVMATEPSRLDLSSLVRTSGSTATLSWNIGKSSMTTNTYSLYKRAENGKYYKSAGFEATSEPKYLIKNLSPGTDYSFKMTARNNCGSSGTSEAIELQMPAFPNEMKPVKKSK
jgi:hypothetical protein